MRIVRGVMLCIGIALVVMASMADEWEPVHILLAGGAGLAMCWTAGKISVETERRRKRWRRNYRQSVTSSLWSLGRAGRTMSKAVDGCNITAVSW